MRRASLLLVLAILTFGVLPVGGSSGSDNQVEWVAASLKEMQTIKVGMTRADLLKVFEGEGGLSSRSSRQYVYQKCLYFKVSVQFEPVGAPDGPGSLDGAQDKIVKISKPFLEWPVLD